MTSGKQNSPDGSSQPGKVRTWWHPLLVRVLDFELHDAYEVRGEVPVGLMPLRVDIVLIRRQEGQLPESAERDLSAIVQRLNRFTLLEFKAPLDALETGDLDYLFGCAHLFCAQQSESVEHTELTLIVLAPAMNEAFLADVRRRGLVAREQAPGIHRIDGPMFATWMIETDPIAGPEQPILSLFSRVFLRERHRIMEHPTTTRFARVVLCVLQQIQQFQRAGEGFQMAHADVDVMDQVYEDLKAAVLQAIPPEERLRGLPPEERLRGLLAEEVLAAFPPGKLVGGLTAEQILAGLNPQELARLRALLESERAEPAD